MATERDAASPSLVPTPQVRGWVPLSWWGGATLETGSSDGVVHVVISCEQVASDLGLDAYVVDVEAAMLRHDRSLRAGDADLGPPLHGHPTRVRLIEWQGDHGEALTTLLVVAVADGWGVRCAGTAPAAVFSSRRGEITDLLDGAELPFARGPVATTSIVDVEHLVRRAVAAAIDAPPTLDWATCRQAWLAAPSDATRNHLAERAAESVLLSGPELASLANAAGSSTFPGAHDGIEGSDLSAAGAARASRLGLLSRGLVAASAGDGSAELHPQLAALVHAALKATLVIAIRVDHPLGPTTSVLCGHPTSCVLVSGTEWGLYRLTPVAPDSVVDLIMAVAGQQTDATECELSVLFRQDGRAEANSEVFAVRSGRLVSAQLGDPEPVSDDQVVRSSIVELLPR